MKGAIFMVVVGDTINSQYGADVFPPSGLFKRPATKLHFFWRPAKAYYIKKSKYPLCFPVK